MSRLLILDDNEKICDTLSRNFQAEGFECLTAHHIEDALEVLRCCPIDFAIVDVCIGEENGIDALREMRALQPDILVIMITGFATIETAVQAIKLGAAEYIKKPVRFPKLLEMVNSFLVNRNPMELPALPYMLTRNAEMQSVIKKALKLAQSQLSVLILGDSGTGKELMADLLHEHSSRKNNPLEKVNCAAFPDSLLDNELFGHEKGAYTGADDSYEGVFERADTGTLFLDELGDMPLPIQAKILRAIQEQEIRRLGGKKIININVRFIGATNRDLNAMVQSGEFRGDLFYRLNCACLRIPTLKERIEDIPLLVNYFLNQYSMRNGEESYTVSEEAINTMLSYDWPGNIRELKAAAIYGATVCANHLIKPQDLPMFNTAGTESGSPDETGGEGLTPGEILEKELLQKTLIRHSFNKKKAAEHLGISRTTLYSKMEKYEIRDTC